MKKVTKEFEYIAYFILACGFAVGGYVVYSVRFEAMKQFVIVLLMAAFYIVWGGVFHHYKNDFKLTVFLEYFFVALIAIGAAVLVFLR